MSLTYQFKDKGLEAAILRFQERHSCDELFLAQSFLEKYINALETNDDTLAGANVVLNYATKIASLRAAYNKGLVEQKVYLHRESLPSAIAIVANAVAEVLKPLDPCGLLMDQVAKLVQKGFEDAIEKIDGE